MTPSRMTIHRALSVLFLAFAAPAAALAQGVAQPDWNAVQEETMRHFQALLRANTADGNEKLVADYLVQVFQKEGIPVQVFALDPARPNVVARLKGNGSKRPLLVMGHEDVVSVDSAKWTFPPFSATRNRGYVYGRGSVDDKDNVVAGLMIMLMLKRMNVPLDRDVIFLAEAGEEGSSRVGIQYMVSEHVADIDAEYCLAEGGGVARKDGKVAYATIQTLEKRSRGIILTARGTSGHGSVPLQDNAIVHLSRAVAAVAAWRTPVRLNETTRAYFERLATISSPEDAARYRAVLSPDPRVVAAADEYFAANEPRHASMLRTSVSPNIITGGYRSNVIPSEAKATLDVRMLQDEDPDAFLAAMQKVINDPQVVATFSGAAGRPGTAPAKLGSEAFSTIEAAVKRNYQTVTIPTMGTGATDMSQLRGKGMDCYGVGPAIDVEDGPKGFGAHSDQERILETELHRWVRFEWEVVRDLARARLAG